MDTISNTDYDSRKQMLADLKILSKTESLKAFEIIKQNKVEYSENSNGIFFDLLKISNKAFKELDMYIEFCKKVRIEQNLRDEDERIAQENLQ
jgi:hypothetical protein